MTDPRQQVLTARLDGRPVEVEAHLLPPGYEPPDQVDAIPSGTDKT